jgi:hypothetical protein
MGGLKEEKKKSRIRCSTAQKFRPFFQQYQQGSLLFFEGFIMVSEGIMGRGKCLS